MQQPLSSHRFGHKWEETNQMIIRWAVDLRRQYLKISERPQYVKAERPWNQLAKGWRHPTAAEKAG